MWSEAAVNNEGRIRRRKQIRIDDMMICTKNVNERGVVWYLILEIKIDQILVG